MTSPAITSAPPLSEPQRIINTFIAPSKTFTDLRRSAAWWGPFILMSLVSTFFVYEVDHNIGFHKVVENQIQLSPKAQRQMEQMPAADREHAIQQQTKFWRGFSYGYPAIILIWNVIVAAVLFATFKFAASADVKFKIALAIVMYASLAITVRSVLAAASIAAGAAPDSFTFQNPVASNPGYFLNPADSPFLYSVLSALDVFMIWTLFLTALGFTYTTKVKRSTAMLIVFGWYFVFVICSAGFGAMFS